MHWFIRETNVCSMGAMFQHVPNARAWRQIDSYDQGSSSQKRSTLLQVVFVIWRCKVRKFKSILLVRYEYRTEIARVSVMSKDSPRVSLRTNPWSEILNGWIRNLEQEVELTPSVEPSLLCLVLGVRIRRVICTNCCSIFYIEERLGYLATRASWQISPCVYSSSCVGYVVLAESCRPSKEEVSKHILRVGAFKSTCGACRVPSKVFHGQAFDRAWSFLNSFSKRPPEKRKKKKEKKRKKGKRKREREEN